MFRDLSFYKIIFIFIILILVFVIIEPENIRYLSYIGTTILVLSILSMLYYNLELNGLNTPYMKAYDFSHFFPFVGSQMFGIESIGLLITVRSTMKRRSQAPKMILYSMIGIFFMFVINGLSFYSAHLSAKDFSFFYFPKNVYLKILEIGFYITTPSTFMTSIITMMMILEEISYIRKFLLMDYSDTKMDPWKVRVFRTSVMTILLFVCFFGNS